MAPSFLDFVDRPSSFLLPLSRALSLTTLRVRLTVGKADEVAAQGREARLLLLVLLEEDSE